VVECLLLLRNCIFRKEPSNYECHRYLGNYYGVYGECLSVYMCAIMCVYYSYMHYHCTEQQLEPFLHHVNVAIDSIPEDGSIGLRITQFTLLLQVKRRDEACHLMHHLFSMAVSNTHLYRYDVILKTISFQSKWLP